MCCSAARDEGVERVVYTSTVGTLGLDRGRPGDRADYPDVTHLFGSYKRSKYVAEHEVLRAAAEGLSGRLVLPTFPLGPGDRAPTPSGRLILDFLNGRMPAYVDTVLNVVHVDDVARGHLLARERGANGRSYIFGGENYTLRALIGELAESPVGRSPTAAACRIESPWPRPWASEFVEGSRAAPPPARPTRRRPDVETRMAFDDTRARTELGYAPRPRG